MKINKIINAALAFILLFIVSCNMERKPKSVMDADNALLTVSDAEKWGFNQMSSFRTKHGSIYNNVQEKQADMLNASATFGNRGGSPHGWNSFDAQDYDLRDVWMGYYIPLKNLNYSLPLMEKIAQNTKKEKDVVIMNHVRGNAYFFRAYYNFCLALRFGTPYAAASADKDLCIPLVLEYNPTGLPKRSTNATVYDQILNKDLAKAKELLKDVAGKPMATEITADALVAFEARVKLYMSDWNGALAAAEALINTNKYPLNDATPEAFQKMWINDYSKEIIQTTFISKPDELPNGNSYYGASKGSKRGTTPDGKPILTGANTPDWLPPQWVVDLYDDADLRKDVYFEKQITLYTDNNYELYVIAKAKGNPAYSDEVNNPALKFWEGYLPNGIHAPKIFRISEMYLIASEAAYNMGDEAKAIKYLQALRNSRGLKKTITVSGAELYQLIKDERTRELAYEGFRLWDLRRWGEPMKRHAPQTNAKGESPFLSVRYTTLEMPADHPKFVWGIPQNDLNTNPNLQGQQTPGWGL